MPFRCKFCEQRFCSRHRLPENHDCDGLEAYQERSRGEGKISYDVFKDRPTPDEPEPSLQPLRRWLPTTLTNTVLTVIAAVFLLQLLDWTTGIFGGAVTELLVLDVGRLPATIPAAAANPLQLVHVLLTLFTSIFLHGSPFHLFVNAIVLYQFGNMVENIIGSRRFATVLFGSALASSIGFVLSVLLFSVTTQILGTGQPPVDRALGISGGLYGIVALLAMIRPRVTVLAFFIIPLTIRKAVMFFAAVDTINFLAHAAGYTFLPFASAGHLSGLLVGLYLARTWRDRYRRLQPMHVFGQ